MVLVAAALRQSYPTNEPPPPPPSVWASECDLMATEPS